MEKEPMHDPHEEEPSTTQANQGLTSENDQGSIDMESILKALCPIGRYQIIQMFFCSIPLIPLAFVTLNFVFIGFEPPHTCQLVNETELLAERGLSNDETATVSVDYGHCFINVNSNKTGQETNASLGCFGGYEYNGGKQVSMVTEWDLVCDKIGIVQLTQTLFIAGYAVGSLLSTYFADRFGRKQVFIIILVASTLLELMLAFAPNIYVVIALRFLSGFTVVGIWTHCFVLCVEQIPSSFRQIYGMGASIFWSCGIALMAGIAFLFRDQDWRHFQLVIPAVFIPIYTSIYFINESPAWLFAKGRYEEAKRILRQACKTNKKDAVMILGIFDQMVDRARIMHSDKTSKEIRFNEANYTLFDIIRNRQMLAPVSVLSLAWFSCSLIYYGIYLTSSALAGNRFLNFFIMAALEVPASFVSIAMLMYLGRRTVILILYLVSGISLFISTILVAIKSDNSDKANASTAFFVMGKAAIGAAFTVVCNYTPEIFPTSMRASGLGFCSFMARVSGMIAPFMLPLFTALPWLPGTILTALCAMCFICVRTLPETRGKELPTTIDDFISLIKNDAKKATKNKNSEEVL